MICVRTYTAHVCAERSVWCVRAVRCSICGGCSFALIITFISICVWRTVVWRGRVIVEYGGRAGVYSPGASASSPSPMPVCRCCRPAGGRRLWPPPAILYNCNNNYHHYKIGIYITLHIQTNSNSLRLTPAAAVSVIFSYRSRTYID